MNGWEILLILMVVMVLFAARRGFHPNLTVPDRKKALFYLLMTLGAIAVGCGLAVLVAKAME